MHFSPMTQRLLKTASLIALLSLPALLPAQTETSGKEDERLEALARSEGEWYAPKTKISVGFRMLNSGGKVDFSNLGSVPTIRDIAPVSAGAAARVYDNGRIFPDTPRANELANGVQTSVPGGRYEVTSTAQDGTVFVTENLISYTTGLTRDWETLTNQQFGRPGYASFNTYSATSEGGSATHKQGATGGVEFQISRDIGRGSRNFQWGVIAGITLNDINSKSAGTIISSLNTHTDYYTYDLRNGQPAPTGIYNSLNAFTELLDSNGVQINPFGLEIAAPLSVVADPALSTDRTLAGAATVNGRWQVKGSYFMFRLGPSLRTQITDRLGLTASVGLAGAYAGTRYSAYESFANPAVAGELIETADPISSTTAKFLRGYFADLNLEWTANEILGLFGGVSAQQLSDYEQKLGDRSARVDLGSAVGVRGGISIRF